MIEGQMGTQPLNGNDARAILNIAWQWIEDANNDLGSNVDALTHKLRQAGYGPVHPDEETV